MFGIIWRRNVLLILICVVDFCVMFISDVLIQINEILVEELIIFKY
jgi:hypothetical protein